MILFISFAGFSAYLMHMQRTASLRHIKNVILPAYGEKLTLQLEELAVPPIEAVGIFLQIRGRPWSSAPGKSITGYFREMMKLEALQNVRAIDFFHAEENVLYSFDGENLTGSRFGFSNRWVRKTVSKKSSSHIDILYTPHKENSWLYYRHPLYDDSSSFLGFIGLRIDHSEFTEALLRNLSSGQSVTIVNRNGQVLFDSDGQHQKVQRAAEPGFISRTRNQQYLGPLNQHIGITTSPKTVIEKETVSYMKFNPLLNTYIIAEQHIEQYAQQTQTLPLLPILILGAVTLGLNIFMIISYQRKIWEKNSQLVKLNDEKDLYLSVMSHKVNNTLAVLSNELREKNNGKNLIMLSWVDSTKRLITNIIMNMKHLSSNRPVHLDETVDLREHLQFLILRNRDKTELKNQNISFSSCPEPVFIPTNKEVLEEIVENLIDNAVKYSYQGSDIAVGLDVEKSNAVITVRDQGPGFTEQDIGKIFSPFTLLTAKPTGGEASTGLGLFVASRLAEKLGGTLRLDPDYSGGALFVVTLPIGGPERTNL